MPGSRLDELKRINDVLDLGAEALEPSTAGTIH